MPTPRPPFPEAQERRPRVCHRLSPTGVCASSAPALGLRDSGGEARGTAVFPHAPWARKRCSEIIGDDGCGPEGQPPPRTRPVPPHWRALVPRSFLGGSFALSPVRCLRQPFIAKDDVLTAVTRPCWGQQDLAPRPPQGHGALTRESDQKPSIDQSVSPVPLLAPRQSEVYFCVAFFPLED